ncbi:MAG: ribbon-helix-helix domain-containing protein [Cyanobacteriota bacterium]
MQTPKRISITVPYVTYQKLLGRSDQEGRSLSNLAAYLLDMGTAYQAKQTDHTA